MRTLRALRRAGGRRRPGGLAAALAAAAAARGSSCATSRRSSAARCWPNARARSTASRPQLGWRERSRRSRATRASRCCRAPPPSATSRTIWSALNERLTDHLADPPTAGLPRERLWQVRAREVVLATGAIERPLVFPGNDRPGIMLAGAARTYPQSLRRAGRHARGGRDRLRRGAIARRSSCKQAGVVHRRDRRCARRADGPAGERRAPPASAGADAAPRSLGTHGRLRVNAVALARARAAAELTPCRRIACDLRADVRRLHPERASVLAVARQARLGRGACRRSCPAQSGGARALAPAPAAASSVWRRCCDGRRRGRCRGRAMRADRAHGVRRRRRAAPGGSGDRRAGRARRRAAAPHAQPRPQGVRRLAERCHHARTWRSRCARASARSSTSSATPPPAWRPTRARPRTSTRSASSPRSSARRSPQVGLTTFRMPYTPVTLRQLRRACARRAVRPGAHHADARLGGGARARCSRTSACGSAPAISRAPARTCTRRWRASAVAVRSGCGIFDASTLGKIEVVGPDAVDLHEPHVRERLDQPRRRAAAATACCCARTASSRRRRGGAHRARTASTSPPPPAARRACWR